MKHQKVPDIYIIGAQKSGTSTLYDWLAQHPQIYGHPHGKDYGFFGTENMQVERTRQFYSFFNKMPPGMLALGGEASAMYAAKGPQRMHAIMPQARLIAILRDPVDRAYSAYTYAVERLMEERTFEQAIADEMRGMQYEPQDALQRDYLGHGRYAEQLEEVFRYFPKEQVKVILFEELKADAKGVLKDLFQWLGVDAAFQPVMAIKNKTQGGARFKWLAKLTYAHPSSEWVRALGRALIPFSVRTALRRKLVEFNRVPAPKPEFPERVRRQLQEYYLPEIACLEKLLGKPIDCWKKG